MPLDVFISVGNTVNYLQKNFGFSSLEHSKTYANAQGYCQILGQNYVLSRQQQLKR